MSKNDAAPRIVRRKVVAGDGHHGGAWKVAIFEGSNFRAFQRRFTHCRFGKIGILTVAGAVLVPRRRSCGRSAKLNAKS